MPKTELKPFEQALLDAAMEEFADIPAEEKIELELSEDFESRGEALVEKARRGGLSRVNTTLRRIILVAAIIAALATTAMAVPVIRRELVKFTTSDAGTHYEFSFDPEKKANAPKYIEKVYEVTYIPRGYKLTNEIIHMGCVYYDWTSKSEEFISFMQMPIPNDGEGYAPDSEDVTSEMRDIDGYEVFIVYSEGAMYYWTDDEYFCELVFPDGMSERERDKIFNSVHVDEDAPIPDHS